MSLPSDSPNLESEYSDTLWLYYILFGGQPICNFPQHNLSSDFSNPMIKVQLIWS